MALQWWQAYEIGDRKLMWIRKRTANGIISSGNRNRRATTDKSINRAGCCYPSSKATPGNEEVVLRSDSEWVNLEVKAVHRPCR